MRASTTGLILLSVLLSSGSQIALKYGMMSQGVQSGLATGGWRLAVLIASSPLVVLGLGCFALSALVWLSVLSRVPLSTAYPFVALGIVVTASGGFLLFGDAISAAKVLGILLIVSGVLSISAGA